MYAYQQDAGMCYNWWRQCCFAALLQSIVPLRTMNLRACLSLPSGSEDDIESVIGTAAFMRAPDCFLAASADKLDFRCFAKSLLFTLIALPDVLVDPSGIERNDPCHRFLEALEEWGGYKSCLFDSVMREAGVDLLTLSDQRLTSGTVIPSPLPPKRRPMPVKWTHRFCCTS